MPYKKSYSIKAKIDNDFVVDSKFSDEDKAVTFLGEIANCMADDLESSIESGGKGIGEIRMIVTLSK